MAIFAQRAFWTLCPGGVNIHAGGRRLALINATEHERQILKIRPPLVFSSKDAKLFVATLDEVLTALWRSCTIVD